MIAALKEQQGANEAVIDSLREQVQKWKGKLTVTSMHIESLPVKEARPVETLRTLRMNADKTKTEMANILTVISEITAEKDQKLASLEVVVKELKVEKSCLLKQ